MKNAPVFCILNSPLGSVNHGVVALGISAIKGLKRAFPEARFLIQGAMNLQQKRIEVARKEVVVETIRVRWRRLKAILALSAWLPEAFRSKLLSFNGDLKNLLNVDVFFDVSGGDSFTDMTYGLQRFKDQVAIKSLIMRLKKPLVLLPQKYGPFQRKGARRVVENILRYCSLAATRDQNGLLEMRKMFGRSVQPERFVLCPDMAFILDPVMPSNYSREAWALAKDEGKTIIGLNVSGLLYYGTKGFPKVPSYKKLIRAIIDWAMSFSDTYLVLTPHVVVSPMDNDPVARKNGTEMSDTAACQEILSEISERYKGRMSLLEGGYSAQETKGIIGRYDFFLTSRMHAGIAALSQCVPTMILSYSKKAAGILSWFDSEDLAIASDASSEENIPKINKVFWEREEIKKRLHRWMPIIQNKVNVFFETTLREVVCRDMRGFSPRNQRPALTREEAIEAMLTCHDGSLEASSGKDGLNHEIKRP